MYKKIASWLLGISLFGLPLVTQATDSRITSVEIVSQSETSPATLSAYEITLVTSATISANEKVNILVEGDVGIDQTFDFTNTTYTSDTISGTVTLEYAIVFTITLDTDLTAGTHTILLSDVLNGNVEGTNYHWAANSVATLGEGMDTTTDSKPFSLGETGEPTLFVFGTNIAISWDENANTTSYGVIVSKNSDISNHAVIDVGNELSYLISDLDPKTKYYIHVISYKNDVRFPASYLIGHKTTEKNISKTRQTKPTVPAAKIKVTSATVKWPASDDADYISSYSLRLLLNDKLVHTYKNIDALSKKLQQLKSGKTYSVQLRATYTTGEKTQWSKKVEFTTDSQ